jgi:hypothetical protein
MLQDSLRQMVEPEAVMVKICMSSQPSCIEMGLPFTEGPWNKP